MQMKSVVFLFPFTNRSSVVTDRGIAQKQSMPKNLQEKRPVEFYLFKAAAQVIPFC